MLATLLITRQFLQNIKEVSQPHLYSKFKRGDFSIQNFREVAHTLFRLLTQKYTLIRPLGAEPQHRRGPPQAGHGPEPPEVAEGVPKGEKKCLNGGCGVPEEEEEDEKKDSDSEDESILDCGLKLKKVSFIEKADRKSGEIRGLEEVSFLEEGSPTMVEKGMDPASVFELCEDDDESDGASGSPTKSPPEGKEPVVVMRARRPRGTKNLAEGEEEEEDEEEKPTRTSWIDPPEENYTTQLAQAEVESCMKKYEVRGKGGDSGSLGTGGFGEVWDPSRESTLESRSAVVSTGTYFCGLEIPCKSDHSPAPTWTLEILGKVGPLSPV